MFNFKSTPVKQNSTLSVVTAQQIHDDFDNWEEQRSKEVFDNGGISEETMKKAKLMHSLGFVNSIEVKPFISFLDKKSRLDRDKDDVEQYKKLYPDYKFIPSIVVSALCDKYHLIIGDPKNYKGDIPMKNLKEIAAFKENPEDRSNEYSFMQGSKMKICAPVKLMEIQTGQKMQGNMIVPEDPIVLWRLYNGYLIISKWGNEGNDQSLVKPKDN